MTTDLSSGSLRFLELSGPVQGCTEFALLTEWNSDICHQHNDDVGDEEPQETGVEAHQVVGDTREDDRQGGEDGHFGQRLAQEVHVDTVHAVEVFPQEDRHLSAEHLDIDVKFYLELFALTQHNFNHYQACRWTYAEEHNAYCEYVYIQARRWLNLWAEHNADTNQP